MKYRKQFQEKVFSEQDVELTVKIRGDVDFSVFEGENVCVQVTGVGFRTYSGVAKITHVAPVVFKSMRDLGTSIYEETKVEQKEQAND